MPRGLSWPPLWWLQSLIAAGGNHAGYSLVHLLRQLRSAVFSSTSFRRPCPGQVDGMMARRHALYVLSRRNGRSFTIILITSVGIQSGPGALRVPIEKAAVRSSSDVNTCISSNTGGATDRALSGWSGNRVLTMRCIVSRSRGGSEDTPVTRRVIIW